MCVGSEDVPYAQKLALNFVLTSWVKRNQVHFFEVSPSIKAISFSDQGSK